MFPLCWPYASLCWCYVGLNEAYVALCRPQLPLSCHYVDPMFAYVGLRNALPHSSDRKGGGGNGVGTGWGGGDDGVGTG